MNLAGTNDASVALARRLVIVQDVLGVSTAPATVEGVSLLDALVSLVEVVREARDPAVAWLLIVGLTGAMPDQALVRSVARALSIKEPEESVIWLLDAVAPLAMRDGNAEATLRIVTDRPLVDVNFTAKSDFLTGIQRVVRGVAASWDEGHDVEFVVWTARGGAYRNLHTAERGRLLEREVGAFVARTETTLADTPEIVVPWGVPIVLLEVPSEPLSDRLAAVAELTRNSLRLVGYDCIPVSSAETVPLAEPEKFGRYLELVKFSDRLAGISRTAAAEFAGFTRALAAQGLPGPLVTACPLPHSTSVSSDTEVDACTPGRPVVVCVGTVGRRKNQVALIEAAEVLWREGVDLELRIFGHLGAERSPLVGLVPELQGLGRPLVVESGVSDARIASTLAHARCLVFPSLHEGFGLPIVEALSHGVPVITSDFGSAREVAEGQGGLLVDPEDVQALASALRTVLTDDNLHARLVAEAKARPTRSWAEYSVELWEALLA